MSGKQVDSTRQEIFVTLEYLLENCYDIEHTSKTIELTEYASRKYNINLDRRRANDILEFLAGCSENYPEVLPFTVMKVKGKPRYYIERTLFSKNTTYNKGIIDKIVGAIYRDKALSASRSNKIADIFLNTTCNTKDKDKITNRYNKKKKYYSHVNEELSDKFIMMDELIEDGARFRFKTKKSVSLEACSNLRVYQCLKLRPAEADGHVLTSDGFIYAIPYSFYNGEDVCLYFPYLNGAAIVNINNIIIQRNSVYSSGDRNYDFELSDSPYQNIDEFVDKYLNGEAHPIEIKFKYVVGFKDDVDEYVIGKIKKAYLDFFRKDMEYTLEEREHVEEARIPGEEPRRITYIDLHSSVLTSFSAFRKWYWDYGMFEHLVVVEPNILNNRLLEAYIERFKIRIEKYGETREQKEERIRAMRERREAFRQKVLERRARRLAEQQTTENNDNNDGGN